jgi:phosphohistidine phosphatase
MRTLYLMRHCKSRWDDPEVDDYERGLTERGKRDARRMGRALAGQAPPPDLIVTSPARRARTTARRVARAWGYHEEIRQVPALYGGGPLQYVQMLRGLSDQVSSALFIGHNPTLENLIWALGGPRLPMPTGATVCLELAVESWEDLTLASESSVRFRLEPRSLREAEDTAD